MWKNQYPLRVPDPVLMIHFVNSSLYCWRILHYILAHRSGTVLSQPLKIKMKFYLYREKILCPFKGPHPILVGSIDKNKYLKVQNCKWF